MLSAVIASVVAPWASWSVEKRRSERDQRKAMVASWREGIAKLKGAEVAATGTHEALARTQAIEGTDAPWAPGTDVRFQSWYSTPAQSHEWRRGKRDRPARGRHRGGPRLAYVPRIADRGGEPDRQRVESSLTLSTAS